MRKIEVRSSWQIHSWWPFAIFLIMVTFAAPPATMAGGVAGFFGGLNIANLGGDMDKVGNETATELEAEFGGTWSMDKTTRSGLAFGAFYAVSVSPTFGFQFEAQYAQRGVVFDLRGTDLPGIGTVDIEVTTEVDNIEFPLLARFTPSSSGSVQPIILAGPVVSLRSTAKLKASAMGQSESTDISDGIKSTAFGLLGGIGLAIRAAETSSVVLQARYYLGLTNVLDHPTYQAKSGDFGFFAGMEFAVGQ